MEAFAATAALLDPFGFVLSWRAWLAHLLALKIDKSPFKKSPHE